MEMHESFESGLLKILVRLEVITTEDAHALEKSFHDSDVDQFDNFLLQEGIVSEDHLLKALSEYYQVPSFDVIGYFFERHYVRMFPKDLLLRYSIIPLDVDENMMVFVANNPNDPDLLFEIGQYVSYDIRFYVGIGRDICDSVKDFYDKADTEDLLDDDVHDDDEYLVGDLHFSFDDQSEESLVFSLDHEDLFD